jgi:hypothetical protein
VRGAVLVRRPGETAQANPGEIGALEDRFATPLLDALADRSRDRLEKISQAVDAVFDVVKGAKPSDRPPVQWTLPEPSRGSGRRVGRPGPAQRRNRAPHRGTWCRSRVTAHAGKRLGSRVWLGAPAADSTQSRTPARSGVGGSGPCHSRTT